MDELEKIDPWEMKDDEAIVLAGGRITKVNLPEEMELSDKPVPYVSANQEFQLTFPSGCAELHSRVNEPDLFGGETYDDIVNGKEGQYVVRLKDNTKGYDTTYPGVEVLSDGTFVVTTYGHWSQGEQPYILSVRFKLDELDAMAKGKPE